MCDDLLIVRKLLLKMGKHSLIWPLFWHLIRAVYFFTTCWTKLFVIQGGIYVSEMNKVAKKWDRKISHNWRARLFMGFISTDAIQLGKNQEAISDLGKLLVYKAPFQICGTAYEGHWLALIFVSCYFVLYVIHLIGYIHWSQFQSIALQWRHNERHGVSNHQPHESLLRRFYRRRSKKTSMLRVTGLCEGNPPATTEFPAQRVSNVKNVSIWWRHHGLQKNAIDMVMYCFSLVMFMILVHRAQHTFRPPVALSITCINWDWRMDK